MTLVTAADVDAAAERIDGYVHKTPLLTSRTLSERFGQPIFIKAENLQKAGSFKARGAFNCSLSLTDEERQRGLLTYSSGNHGQAVAYAAKALGVKAVVVMPEDAPEGKRAACEGYGAEIQFAGFTSDQRRARALEIEAERGMTIIQPFDDARIIAGQGTCGREILQDAPDTDTIVVPIGGGGLVSGILAATRPQCRVIGVEPEAACAMHTSLKAGEITAFAPRATIADGLKPVQPGDLNFEHARELGLEVVTVTEDEIREGLKFLFERARIVAEPSGAATVAALLAGKIDVRGPLTFVVSGGNVDARLYAKIIQGQR